MKPPKRISPATLRAWLDAIRAAVNPLNYGIAEDMIELVMDCMDTKYDWKRLKGIEIDEPHIN